MTNGPPPLLRGAAARTAVPRYQATRLQRQVAEIDQRLERWAANPWRRLSLLLIVLLSGFVIGNGVGMLTGAFSAVDQLGALVCVAVVELAVRLRGPLLRRNGADLRLQLLDMARIGLVYGLLLDGVKLLF